MLKISKRLLVQGLIISAMGVTCAFAASSVTPVPVKIVLTDLKVVKPTEKSGDELYFSVTEYSSVDHAKSFEVPEFPEDWLSGQVKDLKRVVLWEKMLQDNESAMVVISLLDRDAPPWDMDDLVGTIKFKVKNSNGKIQKEWSIPNKSDTKVIGNEKSSFELTGDGGDYKMDLLFEQKPVKVKARQ